MGGQMPRMQTEHGGSREAGKGAMLELWITWPGGTTPSFAARAETRKERNEQ